MDSVCANFGADQMEWTAWEKIDLDIVGEHVMIFVFGGDLHVAWPVIKKTSKPDPQDDTKNIDTWEVQMAWARRTTRGWSKKKISRDTITADRLVNKDENQSWTFRVGAQSSTAGTGGSGSLLGLETTGIACYTASETEGQPLPDIQPPVAQGLDVDLPQVSIAATVYWKRGTNYVVAQGASLWLKVRGLDPNKAQDEAAAYNVRSGRKDAFGHVTYPLPFKQADVNSVSNDIRNVPMLATLEMSPFRRKGNVRF